MRREDPKPLSERHRTSSIRENLQPAPARRRGLVPRRHSRRTLVLCGLGAVWVVVSVVIGYSLGSPYLKGRRQAGDQVAFTDRPAVAKTSRHAETSAAHTPTASDELAASRGAFERELRGGRRWTWLAAVLAATLGVVSIILGVRLRRAELARRRLEENAAGEALVGGNASPPWTAPPPSPIELLRAARADLDEARREAAEALSVDPTLLGRDETLPMQTALLEDDLIKLRRSRIALENRFSANLALGFDADLQGRIARGDGFPDPVPATGDESANVESPSCRESDGS